MPNLHDKIEIFLKKQNGIFEKPLRKIIDNMLEKCRYYNEESLERHNFGDNPIKLKNIPTNINSPLFEKELINALNLEENESSTIELLWGDIQLGKRIHACIIMWFSIHIFERPVLYIFRNLSIDETQLKDDISGTTKYSFNTQFIKNIFEPFNKEIQEFIGEAKTDFNYWKRFKLPELKSISNNDNINKLSNKDAINFDDIFCCLMNHKQLDKINSKFNENISYNNELINITILVDESDLLGPTASNDITNNNDKRDSTKGEILLAKIYKKCKYVLHITGTAHSLLYNVTTRLSDNIHVHLKISKVHKMKRSVNYYGLFNDAITFNTTLVESWWSNKTTENNVKTAYNINDDYDSNIKKLINTILQRPNVKYNSLLISEEKIRINQFSLINKIIKDFQNLFILIYHGDCLRLYLAKKYVKIIKYYSEWDSNQLSKPRLWQEKGIYDLPKNTDENSEKLPNKYCYFDIDTKILNIKLVYKLLSILFKESEIEFKTVITITGKYGERGYSFTSDDFEEYSFHLTDQYFVSHASLNCTASSQCIRLQGKYPDIDLQNGNMKLTLWTTYEIKDIMQNFYVKFIKYIEKFIMDCTCWEDIKELLENIIDTGDLKFSKYMKHIDVLKKRKNIEINKHYDKKHNGYKLILIDDIEDDIEDDKISEWCQEKNLPVYECINKIQYLEKENFIKKYGKLKAGIPFRIPKDSISNFDRKELEKIVKERFPILNIYELDRLVNIKKGNINNDRYNGIENAIENQTSYYHYITNPNPNTFSILIYDNYDNIHITFIESTLDLPTPTNNYIKKNPYILKDNLICYSKLRTKYITSILPENYYWKTPDGWLFLYKKEKSEIISLNIVTPFENSIELYIPPEPINNDINLFIYTCFKKTDNKRLRFGLKDIFMIYKEWCEKNDKIKLKTQQKFKEELERLNYKEEISKGVDINKKSHKRGYNIMVSL
tara:strand:+ start:179 stop:3034 length:2856 start_codon:yes stop_codon:yes gene_type:complete